MLFILNVEVYSIFGSNITDMSGLRVEKDDEI
jgi:hypothetical protein